MEIKKLNWDSNFFKKKIYSCTLSNIEEYYFAKEQLINKNADLCYLFVNSSNRLLISELPLSDMCLYDKKVSYFCDDLQSIGQNKSYNIQSYTGNLTNDLLELSFLAGHDSRFNKDPRLAPYFKELYQLWIEYSLNRSIADELFVCTNRENEIAGFVTCKKEDHSGKIGLIATNKIYHGKGIGHALVQAAHNWYIHMNIINATVITQGTNLKACKFYENCGYKLLDETFVYHWWL